MVEGQFWKKMMIVGAKTLAVAALAVPLIIPAHAEELTGRAAVLGKQFTYWAARCYESRSDTNDQDSCRERDAAQEQLRAAGWCLDSSSRKASYVHSWQRCDQRSAEREPAQQTDNSVDPNAADQLEPPADAIAPEPDIDVRAAKLFRKWQRWEALCREGWAGRACQKRDRFADRLARAGWCMTEDGGRWEPCAAIAGEQGSQ